MAEDRYANIAIINITMSAANTLTFQELQTQLGFATGSRDRALAMLIDQIDYFPGTPAIAEMTAASDTIQMAITLSNTITSLDPQRQVLDSISLMRHDMGTAAAAQLIQIPFTKQFFPPLIHAERAMYLGMTSSGLASAAGASVRIFYRTIELTPTELVELVETFRLVS